MLLQNPSQQEAPLLSHCLPMPVDVPPVPTTITKLVKGTRLEPLSTVLATQPKVLHDTIIDCSKSMLKGADNIRQRLLSHSRFKSKVTVRDADGNPEIDPTTSEKKEVDFVPRSLRNPNPVRPSDEIKEDSRTVDIISRTQTLHNEYIAQQTKNIVELSALEITIRKENMLSRFLDIAFKYAKALAIKRVAGTEDDNLTIRKAFAETAAKHAIHKLADELEECTLDYLKTTKNDINAIHVMRHGAAATAEEFTAESEEMINCTYDVLRDLLPLLLGSTLNLIQHHAQKDKDRAVNAALKDFLAEMDGKTAHDDLEEDLDNATANESKMMEMMEDVARLASAKQITRITGILRKKSSGGAKNQAPSSTKRGARQSSPAGRKSSKKSKGKHSEPSSRSRSRGCGKDTRANSPPPRRVKFSDSDSRKADRDNSRSRSRSRPRPTDNQQKNSRSKNKNKGKKDDRRQPHDNDRRQPQDNDRRQQRDNRRQPRDSRRPPPSRHNDQRNDDRDRSRSRNERDHSSRNDSRSRDRPRTRDRNSRSRYNNPRYNRRDDDSRDGYSDDEQPRGGRRR